MNKSLKWKLKAKEILNGTYTTPKKSSESPVINKASIMYKKCFVK
jgi:hypothetical protein